MKRLLVLLLSLSSVALAEFRPADYYYRGDAPLSYVPQPFAAYVSSDGSGSSGTWNPLTGSGGTPISYVPQAYGMYYSTDGSGAAGTWAPWNGSSGSGTITAGTGIAYYNPSGGTTLNGAGSLTGILYGNGTAAPTVATQTQFNNTLGGGTTFSGIRKAQGTSQDIQAIACTDYAGLGCSNIFTVNTALSTPAVTYNGTWVSGGTTTNTKPTVLIEPSGTSSTNWSAFGTGFGVNAPSGWTGNIVQFSLAGSPRFTVANNGTVTTSTLSSSSTNDGTIGMGTSSVPITITRNDADAHPATTIKNGNGSSTGPILCLQNSTQSGDTCQVSIGTNGAISGSSIAAGNTATITAGTNVTSATCVDASGSVVTCGSRKGSIQINGGTATTGTIATLSWTATSTTPVCMISQNGQGGTGTSFLDLGHTAPSTTGFAITAGITVLGVTFNVDYLCE